MPDFPRIPACCPCSLSAVFMNGCFFRSVLFCSRTLFAISRTLASVFCTLFLFADTFCDFTDTYVRFLHAFSVPGHFSRFHGHLCPFSARFFCSRTLFAISRTLMSVFCTLFCLQILTQPRRNRTGSSFLPVQIPDSLNRCCMRTVSSGCTLPRRSPRPVPL